MNTPERRSLAADIERHLANEERLVGALTAPERRRLAELLALLAVSLDGSPLCGPASVQVPDLRAPLCRTVASVRR